MERKIAEPAEPPFDVEGTDTQPATIVRTPLGEDIWLPPPVSAPQSNGCLSRSNEEKLDAAIQYIRKLFHDAAGPQVGGRKFFGRVTMATVWQKGECVEIQPCIEGKDRVIREGM